MTIKIKEEKLLIKKTSHFDLLFKYAFSIPHFAEELFRLVFSKAEQAVFDWSTLRAEKDTFQDLRADAVFSVAMKEHPEIRFRICLLLEHKSQYSYKIFGQMLQYQNWITNKSLEEFGKAWPVVAVIIYNGKKPWKWAKSFQAGLWGSDFEKIPLSLRQKMLNYGLLILDMHDPQVAKAIEDKRFKSRGFLNALRRAWDLKADEGELRKFISLFDTWTGDRGDNLVLSLGDYLWSVVPGMTQALWDKLEISAVREGIFTKGGLMDVKEYIKEKMRQEVRQEVRQEIQQEVRQEAQREARQEIQQEARQEARQEVIFNMLKKSADMAFISEMTGLSVDEINKLKNGS